MAKKPARNDPAGLFLPDSERTGTFPFLVNTDREEIVFAEVTFRIKDEPPLRKRLASLKSFEYDKKDDSWIWLKARSRLGGLIAYEKTLYREQDDLPELTPEEIEARRIAPGTEFTKFQAPGYL
jgi:hypothetical protein